MKQIDFNKLFKRDWYCPLVYKIRKGANGAHDIVFLDSYIHDAMIFLNNIVFKEEKIDIPLERICWELKNSDIETHTCKSHIIINKAADCFFTFNKTFFKKLDIAIEDKYFRFFVVENEKSINI